MSINDRLDEVVRRGVTTAGTAAAVTGNIVDKIRKAKTVVQAQGYNPNVLAIDPAGAEALDLLVTGISGGTADCVFTPGQPAPAPWGLQMRVWKTAGTAIAGTGGTSRCTTAARQQSDRRAAAGRPPPYSANAPDKPNGQTGPS